MASVLPAKVGQISETTRENRPSPAFCPKITEICLFFTRCKQNGVLKFASVTTEDKTNRHAHSSRHIRLYVDVQRRPPPARVHRQCAGPDVRGLRVHRRRRRVGGRQRGDRGLVCRPAHPADTGRSRLRSLAQPLARRGAGPLRRPHGRRRRDAPPSAWRGSSPIWRRTPTST